MDAIVITSSANKRFIVYSRHSAENNGIQFKHWRDARAGEYALTDNGWLVPVLKRYEWDDGSRRGSAVIVTPIGQFNARRKNARILFTPQDGPYSNIWRLSKDPTAKFKRKNKLLEFARLHCMNVGQGMTGMESITSAARQVYGNSRSVQRDIRKLIRYDPAYFPALSKSLDSLES